MTKHSIEKRLAELKAEFESGEKVLAEIENKRTDIKQTLLRISGAIQVLEELLAENTGSSESPPSAE